MWKPRTRAFVLFILLRQENPSILSTSLSRSTFAWPSPVSSPPLPLVLEVRIHLTMASLLPSRPRSLKDPCSLLLAHILPPRTCLGISARAQVGRPGRWKGHVRSRLDGQVGMWPSCLGLRGHMRAKHPKQCLARGKPSPGWSLPTSPRCPSLRPPPLRPKCLLVSSSDKVLVSADLHCSSGVPPPSPLPPPLTLLGPTSSLNPSPALLMPQPPGPTCPLG